MEIFEKSLLKYVDNKKKIPWETGISLGSDILNENQLISKENHFLFVQKLEAATKKFGPYYIIAPDVALLHVAPQTYMKQNSISLTCFKKPILFPGDKKVHFCLALLAIDNNSHLETLSKVATLFSNEKFINDLKKVKNQNGLEVLIERFSKEND